MDIALLNADKNNKNTRKKIRNYRTKAYRTKATKVLIAQENHSQITTELIKQNPLIVIAFAEDMKIDEILKSIHRVDLADQIDKILNIDTINLDQSLKEVITQTIIELAHIQTLRTILK